MSPTRAERLAEVIRSEVSEIIQQGLNDPRIGFVSLTEVEVSHERPAGLGGRGWAGDPL